MVAPLLLTTKHVVPALPRQHVDRPGLAAVLDEPRGVLLLSAPPGYGKTTLVLGWLASSRSTAAWISLDESDNDPAAFLAYLVGAMRTARPDLGPCLDEALDSSPAGAAALIPLLNAIGAAGDPVVVVLDDYHLIRSPEVHDIVSFLVTHLPSGLRLVITTREDPPLPLPRLRARGQLTEFRAADLAFSPDDAHRFLVGSLGLELEPADVERLAARTEGWIAGLQLAGLSLRDRDDATAFIDAFGASDRYIFDYLMDEALERQSPEVRAFLQQTCLLDRLTGSLCDALTGRTDGQGMLRTLARGNLFLLPIDEGRTWYRYHAMLADLLNASLPDDVRTRLHRAAAAWFADHGLAPDAIRHYLLGGDAASAAALMDVAADATLSRGEFHTVVSWSEALPEETRLAHPGLGVSAAWARFFLGDIAGAGAALPSLDGRSLVDPRTNGRHAGLTAWFANRADRAEAEVLARRAIAETPADDHVFRSLAHTTLGEVLAGRDARAAADAFDEAHRLAHLSGRSPLAVGTVYSLATIALVRGQRREAEALCHGAIAEYSRVSASTAPWLGMLYLPLGIALFEADELPLARQHIATGQQLCDQAGLRVTMLGAADWQEIIGLRLAGETEQAWRRLTVVRREAERKGIRRIAAAMSLLSAELHLLEGEPTAALLEVERVAGAYVDAKGAVRDRGHTTAARVRLALGQSREVLDDLDALAREQRAGDRIGRLIDTLVLLALAHERSGHERAAMAAISEALALAAGQDRRRSFMDPVLPVSALLRRARRAAPRFVDDVLGRLGAQASGSVGDVHGQALIEPLSVRELDVLRLVVAGCTNEEIGRELFVTTGTAKWHVHNILGKLGVRNRAALIARATSLGIV